MNERSIFSAALDIGDPAERAVYVASACQADADLQQRVERLLDAHAHAGSVLDKIAAASLDSALDQVAETTLAGTPIHSDGDGREMVIGRYRLLDRIGEGGLGTVFAAEQLEPVRRKVALKVIKPGMDSREVVARFEAERQALALMDHNHIARVLDGGTIPPGAAWAGRPFFVMELVKGTPITRYCDEHRLTPRERLDLFIPVCHAVQHAHLKGIIHRDLKPSNILVAESDAGGLGVPKVIDFGIAKATQPLLAGQSIATSHGQIIGTLEYMSPEQAGLNSQDIDTRSDVYSLGVVLYELLTGDTPFQHGRLHNTPFDEALRIIREEEPPKPSTRLNHPPISPPSEGGDRGRVAETRNTEPQRLEKLVRGDVDWIVMKAMEKDRTRRYETASALALDIGRYLKDEPVLACPPSAAYKFKKFARKYRKLLATAAAFAVLLVVAAGVSIALAVRATRAEGVAEEERDRALESERDTTAVNRFIIDRIFAAARPKGQDGGLGKDVTLGEALDQAVPQIASTLGDRPRVEADARHNIGFTYTLLGRNEEARKLLERALELRRQVYGPVHEETISTQTTLAVTLKELGKHAEAETAMRQTLEACLQAYGSDHHYTLRNQSNLGSLLQELNKLDEAETILRQTVEGCRRALAPDHVLTMASQNNLASVLEAQGKLAEAEPLYRETLEDRRRILGPEHPETLVSQNNLAALLFRQQKMAEAEPLFRRTLEGQQRIVGPDHPYTLMSLSNLAGVLQVQGKLSEAEPLYRRSLEVYERVYGKDHPDIFLARNNLATLLRDQGKPAEAEPLFRINWETSRLKFGEDHPNTLTGKRNLAGILQFQGKKEKASRLYQELLKTQRSRHGAEHSETLRALNHVALGLAEEGRWSEAEPLLREVLAGLRKSLPKDHADIGSALAFLGWALTERGDAKEAERLIQEGVDILRKSFSPDHWRLAQAEGILGGCWVALRKHSESEPILLRSHAVLAANPGISPAVKRKALERVIQLYDTWKKLEQAAEWRETEILSMPSDEVTRVLDAIAAGDQQATDRLLPLVYDELRRLARRKLAAEPKGQTLDATGLVHEAYLRLVGEQKPRQWTGHQHFFAAAAEAMRRILVDRARRKRNLKRGGQLVRQDLPESQLVAPALSDDILTVDEALGRLAEDDAPAAELVKLRCFAGLTIPDAAMVLGISPRSADRLWAYARAWLHEHMHGS